MDSLRLRELYHITRNYIDQVDTHRLWPGFRPLRFALYTDELCCFDGTLIDKSPEFLANTAVEYHGEQIAIWNVQEALDPIILASKMIHEMFHGFQHLHHESRFPNELHALYSYCYSNENLGIKLLENRLLTQLAQKFCPQKLSQLLSLRKYRAEHFPEEYLYEAQVEQIEGSANYVELNALQQLSSDLYRSKLEKMCSSILEPSKLFPIRIPSYDIGALHLHILRQNDLPFPSAFSDDPFAVTLIRETQAAASPVPVDLSSHIDAYYSAAQQTIEAALSKNEVIFEGSAPLLGVNYYNAVYCNGYIISKYFVMYGQTESPTVQYGDFVLETHKEGTVTKILAL